MDYEALKMAVAKDAAIRRRQRLQPVGGKGDKIFPPTYPASDLMKRLMGEKKAPPRHVLEQRVVEGQAVWCALVDSVQSQANRLEEALLACVRDSSIVLPHVVVDFRGSGISGVEEITSLDAPHRVYDAIIRDSLFQGEPFPKTGLGLSIASAKMNDAVSLLEISPNALLFGAWNSTGEGGGLGARFPRALVSEIAAFHVAVEDSPSDPRTGELEARTAARRTSSRIDPVGVLNLKGKKGTQVKIFKGEAGWDVSQSAAGRGAKEVKTSEVNHGNITPAVQPLGVTCDYLEQILVMSFAGLRRLGFGGGAKDMAGRAYLAALGLVAMFEQDARGYALRSRCDLVCVGKAPLERVLATGETAVVDLDRAAARALYEQALGGAIQAGLALRREPVRLIPQGKLVAIVKESQRLALEGEGGEADETPAS